VHAQNEFPGHTYFDRHCRILLLQLGNRHEGRVEIRIPGRCRGIEIDTLAAQLCELAPAKDHIVSHLLRRLLLGLSGCVDLSSG